MDSLEKTVIKLFGEIYQELTEIKTRLDKIEERASALPFGYSRLRMSELISSHFSLSGIEGIAFNLDFDADHLPGETTIEKTRSLISYCEKRGTIHQLILECQRQRPNVTWPKVPDGD